MHTPEQTLPPTAPDGLDALCDRFEDALRHGDRPPLADWLARAPTALPDLAALDLHYRLAAGEGVSAADYFARYPELRADPAAAVRLVAVEFRAAAARDPAAATEDAFRQKYPDLAAGQEWSNGPWVDLGPDSGGSGTLVQTRAFHPDHRPDGLPDFLRGVLGPPVAGHPADLGRIGDYRVLGVLGRGGMGAVLRAVDAHLGRPAAVKVMLPEVAARPEARERFLREARAAAAVEHPRVVPVYHVGEAGGVPYIAMPLLKGRSLADRLRAGPPPEAGEVLRVGREIAEGLAAAHAAGLVHRDLKPDNVWLEEAADGPRVRLLDFGLARPASAADSPPLTTAGVVVGTPAYMSPEQAAGRPVDARTDLWSLGVVLYELAAGRRPFAGGDVLTVLSAIATSAPASLPSAAPPGLGPLVSRLLAKDPEARPRSAGDVLAELRRIEAGDSPARTFAAGTPPFKRRPKVAISCSVAVTVCLLIGLGGLSGLFVTSDRPKFQADIGDTFAGKWPPLVVDPPPTSKEEPLRIKFPSIELFARVTDPITKTDAAKHLKTIGRDTADVRLGDQVTVEFELTRPAYCYLVAFRPDGVADPIYPEPTAADQTPPPTDRPRYPSVSAGQVYGLSEGTGLWVFGVVASPRALPPFAQASAGKPVPKVAGGPAPAGAVWWHDGQRCEVRLSGGLTRGAGQELPGRREMEAAVAWLRSLAGPDAVAAAVGFDVRPADQ